MGLFSKRAARKEARKLEAQPPASPYLDWIEHYTLPAALAPPAAPTVDPAWESIPADATSDTERKVS